MKQTFIILIALLFSTSFINAQVVQINQSFSSDTILTPFSGTTPVYSLTMSGKVNLLSDSSLVRVIYIDTYGNHYMVFESYSLITFENAFDTLYASDETTYLDGIICDSLRIDIINAFLDLDSLNLDTNYIPNATELQAQAKWDNDSIKIDIMNQRIEEENMYWRAGRTGYTSKFFQEKEIFFGIKHNLVGFDYYKGGIFERFHHRYSGNITTKVVDWFDWRYRHGATIPESPYFDGDPNETGWLTPLEDQAGCNACWAFTGSHTIADHCNLYFNQHLDYDLSETEILSCSNNLQLPPNYEPCGDCSGGNNQCVLTWVWNENIHFEDNCSVYQPPYVFSCDGPPPVCTGNQEIDIDYWSTVFTIDDIDIIKTGIILNGPLTSGIKFTPATGHSMVMIGFNTGEPGDIVYQPQDSTESPIVLDEDSPLIGDVYLVFKNSYGQTGSGGIYAPYFRQVFNPGTYLDDFDIACKITGPILVYSGLTPEVEWHDFDHDGYYWWGIGPKPDNCPGIPEQEDCDDFDMYAGPYNLDETGDDPLYECTYNPCVTDVNDYEEIISYETWYGIKHMTKNIIIRENATLEIQGELFLTPGVKIIVEAGGLLKLYSTNEYMPAKISSGCGEFWGGIEIWGDPTLSQENGNQGKVEIVNGIIENAVCGIMTGNFDYSPEGGGQGEPYPVYPSGGIIQAEGAIFRNNHIGIEFYPYRDGDNPNLSFLNSCSFITDEALLNSSTPDYFLKLDGINKLEAQGCTFQNTRNESPQTPFTQRGRGIYLYNSAIYLNDTVVYQQQFDLLFKNLEYGIYGMYSGLGSTSLTLIDGELTGNNYGVYLSGFTSQSPVTIQNCYLNLNEDVGATEFYGIYLNNCTGFDVRQNHFSGMPNLSNTFGVIVNNSGGDNNYIYDNYFEYLTYGLQGLNVNRSSEWIIEGEVPVYVPTGLRFICNKFHEAECINDFLINEDLANPPVETGIAYYQKNASNITEPTQEPAGNTFTPPL